MQGPKKIMPPVLDLAKSAGSGGSGPVFEHLKDGRSCKNQPQDHLVFDGSSSLLMLQASKIRLQQLRLRLRTANGILSCSAEKLLSQIEELLEGSMGLFGDIAALVV